MARRQWQSLFDVVFHGKVTVDLPGSGAGSGTSGNATTTVPGAVVGDVVFVSPVTTVFTAGTQVVGDVSAADTVRLTNMNNSAGVDDRPSGVYIITVIRPIGV